MSTTEFWHCKHRIDGALCEECQWRIRLEKLLTRIAEALEDGNETASRAAALEAWRTGQGKHPDD